MRAICPALNAKGILVRKEASGFDFYIVWSAITCHDDHQALGCYVTSRASPALVLNLRKIYESSVRLVAEPEGPLLETLIHLHDMCLLHELTHWGTGDASHHLFWNNFIMLGLVLPLCHANAS